MEMFEFARNKKNIFAFLFFSALWIFILGVSGSVSSGYHLTDDHEIVRIKHDLRSKSTLSVAADWMRRDQYDTHRFRPFYFFHRVLETKVFGADISAWSVYTAVLAVAVSFLLCYFLSMSGFSFWESFLFSLVAMVGPQACIWWRLGPNETIGMSMLSLALLFLGKYLTASKDIRTYKILFVIFSILAALSKESFLLLLPTLIFLLVYLTEKKEKTSWRKAINDNSISIGILSAVFAGCILYIKFFIGTGGVGYAGVDGFNPLKYIKVFLDISASGWIAYFILIQAAVLIFFIVKENGLKKGSLILVRMAFVPGVIFLLVISPQIFLYAKSGFAGRYFLPVMLGYAFILVCFLGEMRKRSKVVWMIMIIGVAFFIHKDVRNDFKDAKKFSDEGIETARMFDAVEDGTAPSDKILVVADPAMYYEWANSLNYYLRYELVRENIFVYALPRKNPSSYSDFNKGLIRSFGSAYGNSRYENVQDKSGFDAFIIFPRMENVFLSNFPHADGLKSDFTEKKVSGYALYSRKDNRQ